MADKREIVLERKSGDVYLVRVTPYTYRGKVYTTSSQYPPELRVNPRFPGVSARDALGETGLRARTGKTGRGVKYAPRALLSKFQEDLAKAVTLLGDTPRSRLVVVNGKPQNGAVNKAPKKTTVVVY